MLEKHKIEARYDTDSLLEDFVGHNFRNMLIGLQKKHEFEMSADEVDDYVDRELGKVVFGMIEAVLAGDKPEINDTETYDNGKKVVPSFLITPEVVVKDDVQTKLIDSGFLKPADVGL